MAYWEDSGVFGADGNVLLNSQNVAYWEDSGVLGAMSTCWFIYRTWQTGKTAVCCSADGNVLVYSQNVAYSEDSGVTDSYQPSHQTSDSSHVGVEGT